MLDTTRAFETPEGIELELHVAGPVARACAWLIDVLIRLLLNIVVSMMFAMFGLAGVGFILIGMFLIEWFYPVVFEVYRGATPGKKMMGLMVVHDDGTPISWQASVLRNFLLIADFLPVSYGLGLCTMLCNRDFKRLGDMAAGTLVIYTPQAEKQYHIPPRRPLPLPTPLQLQEQRAILDFAERAGHLSIERVHELADILQDYTNNKADGDNKYADGLTEPVAASLAHFEKDPTAETLVRYANWIAHGNQHKAKP